MNNQNSEDKIIEKNSSSKLFIIIIALLIFSITIVGVSLATFTYTKEKENINTISTGNIYLNYTEDTNGINITDAYPMADEVGKKLTNEDQYFDFSVKADLTGNVVTNYEIAAEKTETSTLNNDEVRLYLEKKVDDTYQEVMVPKEFTPLKESTEIGTLAGTMLLDKASFKKSGIINYRLRMWVADDAILTDIQKSFGVKVSIKAKVDLDK